MSDLASGATVTPLPAFGIDVDQAQPPGGLFSALRRRFDGRYPIDPFGADPMLQDVLAPLLTTWLRVEVDHPERLPRSGPALLVSNRGSGVVEPTALVVAVRVELERRLRVVGAPDVPLLGDLLRKLGGIMSYREDVSALLRAGHLAALPLAHTWLRTGAGAPPFSLLNAALGYPVIPVAIRPGGPLGLPMRPWRISVGAAIESRALRGSGDPLAAAELSEACRDAVQALLETPG